MIKFYSHERNKIGLRIELSKNIQWTCEKNYSSLVYDLSDDNLVFSTLNLKHCLKVGKNVLQQLLNELQTKIQIVLMVKSRNGKTTHEQ